MDGDGCGKGQEKDSENHTVSYENCTVKQCDPYKAYRYNFHSEWNCLVYHEVGDVGTQFGVGEEPFVAVFVAAEEESCRKQKEWCGWQYREKCSEDTESQSYESQYSKQPFHIYAQKRVS